MSTEFAPFVKLGQQYLQLSKPEKLSLKKWLQFGGDVESTKKGKMWTNLVAEEIFEAMAVNLKHKQMTTSETKI